MLWKTFLKKREPYLQGESFKINMNALKKPFSEKENLIVSSNCSLQDNNNPKMFFPWSGVP